MIYSLAYRMTGSAADAEDLTQETFLAAVGELREGRRVNAPIPWIYGIARHKLLDHYRRQERAERPSSDLDVAPGDAELDTGRGEAAESAIAALAAVAASQRAALVLHYLDGFSASEIANALGKSVEAVESLLARGRVSFKRAYLEAAR